MMSESWDTLETLRWVMNEEEYKNSLSGSISDELEFYNRLYNIITKSINHRVTKEMMINTGLVDCKKVYEEFIL